MTLRLMHIQLGKGGGTERFFVNLVAAFAEAGVAQACVMRDGIDYADAVASYAEIIQGPFMRRTPGGVLARRRLRQMRDRFAPNAMMGWRAPTAQLIPDQPGLVRLVRLGDFPSHPRHLRHLNAVVCNNPAIARHIKDIGYDGPAPVISNFARPVMPVPTKRAEFDTPEDAFLVCGAGRFAHNKGFDTLVRAVAARPDAWLWLVGDGEERGRLEALVAELEISGRVRFLGWASEPMHHIAAADAFVMPSRDEPLGNALIEAWHAGAPSVTTASEGPGWYATDGKDALIVPIADAPAMAAALARLEHEPDLGPSLVKAAHQTLADRFSREAVVAQYLALIAEIQRKS